MYVWSKLKNPWPDEPTSKSPPSVRLRPLLTVQDLRTVFIFFHRNRHLRSEICEKKPTFSEVRLFRSLDLRKMGNFLRSQLLKKLTSQKVESDL
jgi:hypothetical protein